MHYRIKSASYSLLLLCSLALFPASVVAAPGDILYQNTFDDNGQLNADWTRTGRQGNDMTTSTAEFLSGPRSLRIRDGFIQVTQNPGLVDAAVPAANVSFWLRQDTDGGDQPDAGEDLEFYYLNNIGVWVLLDTYLGADPAGTIYTPNIPLPADALYSGLRFRFTLVGGGNADRWYVDDFTVTEAAPPELVPPVANDDSTVVFNGDSQTIDLTSNDTDADSGVNPASIIIVAGPANGSIDAINTDGSVIYTHNGSATNNDSFTYTIADFAGNRSNVATVNITVNALFCESFIDNLNSGNPNNNDGALSFASGWQFRSVASGGLGYARLNNNRLELQGNNQADASVANPYDFDNNWAQRDADLSGYVRATLTFDLFILGDVEPDDEALVEISSDGGISFTTLEVFSGFNNTTTLNRSYDISAFISSSNPTRVRFRIAEDDNSNSCCFGSAEESIAIDNFVIEACSALTLGRYQISLQNIGLTCETAPVVVTALDSLGATVNIPAGTTLSMSALPSGDGWINPNGIASNQFTLAADASSVTFQLRQLTPAILEVDVDDNNGITDDDGNRDDDLIEFVDAGLVFLANGIPNTIGSQIAGKPSNVSPLNQLLQLRAVRTDPQTGQCSALLNNTNADIDFAYRCTDPASCAISENGLAINGSRVFDDQAIGFTSINLPFDNNGTALFNINYFDAGQIELLANADLDVEGVGTANVQGTSNPFAVRPFAIDADIRYPDSSIVNATDASAQVLAIAGTPFDITLRSIVWQASDDQNNDGLPDTSDSSGDGFDDTTADLSDNAVTPNASNLVGDIALLANAQRAGDVDGALTVTSVNFSGFAPVGSVNPGTQTVSQRWDEVGVFTLRTRFNNLLSIPTLVTSSRINIGRFIPASYNFVVATANDLLPQCDSFSYSGFADGINAGLDKAGQLANISGELEALNAAGNRTLNYQGEFATLEAGTLSTSAFDIDASAAAPGTLNAQLSNPLLFNQGLSNFQFTNINYQFNAESAPFLMRVDLNATDADGAVGNFSSSSVEQRLGRLRLENTYGPEQAPLELPLFVEFYDGAEWRVNQADSCTNYVDSQLQIIDLTLPLTAADVSSAATNDILQSGVSVPGTGFLLFNGSTNQGEVLISYLLTQLEWLSFDFDNDNTNDNPSAIAGFGRFRDSDRIIYWREQ